MTNEMYEDLLERNKLQISELNTLTEEQDRRIVELEKEITELEKENAELNKAKEIIKDYLTIVNGSHTTMCGVPEENRTINVLKLNKKAEEFLNSEVEE